MHSGVPLSLVPKMAQTFQPRIMMMVSSDVSCLEFLPSTIACMCDVCLPVCSKLRDNSLSS